MYSLGRVGAQALGVAAAMVVRDSEARFQATGDRVVICLAVLRYHVHVQLIGVQNLAGLSPHPQDCSYQYSQARLSAYTAARQVR